MALKPSLMVTIAKDKAIELWKDVGLLAGIKASDLQQNIRAAPLMIAVIVDTVRLELLLKWSCCIKLNQDKTLEQSQILFPTIHTQWQVWYYWE